MLGKSLLNKLIVAPKYHCVPPNVWRSIPSGCQLGSQDLCCMCIEFTLCLFFSLFLWDKSWPSILCRDNAESFLWVSPESSCLQHSAILRSRVCLACYLESLTAPTFSSLNFSRIIVPEALSRLSGSRDQASLGDSSVFPLSAGPSSVSGLGSPTGTVSVWWHGLTCRSGWWGRGTMGQSGLCRREVALGDRSGDSLVITICCSYISQLFPLSLSHFHKNILNQEVVGNTALSEFSSGQNLILKGSSSN